MTWAHSVAQAILRFQGGQEVSLPLSDEIVNDWGAGLQCYVV